MTSSLKTIKKTIKKITNKRSRDCERRKTSIAPEKRKDNCRHLVIKDTKDSLAYCKLSKIFVTLPGTCLRCGEYILKTDRRSGKSRREP